jgi:hypothetical protein
MEKRTMRSFLRTLGNNGEEATGRQKQVHIDGLHNYYPSSHVSRMKEGEKGIT